MQVGLQLSSVKKAIAHDYFGTLKKVSDIGYKNIELYFQEPYFARFAPPCGAKEFKKRAEDLGLHVVTSQVIFNKLLDWDKIVEYHAELGCGAIVIPLYLYNLTRGNTKPQEAICFSEWLNDMGLKCKANGMEFYYHNYFNEFEVFDGKYIYDLLLENTDPEYVKFEIDTYWTTRGGVDPVMWMNKVGERCDIIEGCDLRKEAPNKNLVEVQGSFNNAFYPKIHTHYDDYCEIGTGMIHYANIIKKAVESGKKYFFVAQPESGEKDELVSAKENYDQINRLIGSCE